MLRISLQTLSFGLAFAAFAAQCARGMEISILQPTYSSFSIEVEPSDSIDNVKQKVQDRIAVNPDSQFLYFGSTLLPEGSTLSDYNVGRGSTLPLVATAAFRSTPLPNRAWSFGVRDVSAGAGMNGWTLWQSSSPLDFSSYGSGAITMEIFSYSGPTSVGTPFGYDPGSTYSLAFLTATGGITNFSPSQFNLLGAFTGLASVAQNGDSLMLNIAAAPVPEIDPSSLGSGLALVTSALGLFERRRLKVKLAV